MPTPLRALISRLALGLFTLVTLTTATACAQTRDDYIDDIDQACASVNARFGDELKFNGKNFGTAKDLKRLAQRRSTLKNLLHQVDAFEIPEKTSSPKKWIKKIDELIKYMKKLKGEWENLPPGSDLYLAMSTGEVDDYVNDVSKAAKGYGLKTCAHTNSWKIFPK
jgi:hypothetical protein